MRARSLHLKLITLVVLVLSVRDVNAAIGDSQRTSSKAFSQVVYSQSPSPTPNQAILTFQAWKSLRVDEARLVLERMTYENQLEKMPVIDRSPGEKQAVVRSGTPARPMPTASQKGGRAESRLESRTEQARMNLEIAQDLTVNDYLVIYLSQFKSREAMLDVARRMPPEDVADLLLANQKLVAGGQFAEHSPNPAPRLSPRPL